MIKKYLSLEKLIEYDTLLKQKIDNDINAIIPFVNTDDDGKILQVSNGKWVAVNLPNAEEAKF